MPNLQRFYTTGAAAVSSQVAIFCSTFVPVSKYFCTGKLLLYLHRREPLHQKPEEPARQSLRATPAAGGIKFGTVSVVN